jgi:hypothetical protein
MALTGRAFLALFNDFDPARDDEYNAWHSREHVPQRLAVPGIARARRYVGRAEPRFTYFTLYEMASAATLQSQPYLDLLANPTPWSAAMRPSFRQFLRIPCRTLASAGEGMGGALAVLVCEASAAMAAAPAAWQDLCGQIAALDGLWARMPASRTPARRAPRWRRHRRSPSNPLSSCWWRRRRRAG